MNAKRGHILSILNQAFAWKHNSLAVYITQIEPYVAPGEEALWAAVKSVAAKDEALASLIGQFIEALGESPLTPPHDPSVAELNYLSIKYLAGRLADKLETELLYYQQNLELTQGCPDATGVLEQLLQDTRNQLSRLNVPT